MIWEIYCRDYQMEFYGWDNNPWTDLYEAKFQFLQKFKPEEWFHQMHDHEIYWVSIAADYGDWTVDPLYLWGWETRPHFYQDDAVRIYPLQANAPPHPGYVLDPHIDIVEEIIHPGGTSWDLAFELGTEPNYVKWSQPFDPDWENNEDKLSLARCNPCGPENYQIVHFEEIAADDWPCENPYPVIAVEWWGSYIGYTGEPSPVPPVRPRFFQLSIWTDMPADPTSDPPWSHPDQLVWRYAAFDYLEIPIGPEVNGDMAFKYFVNIPPEEYFFQEPDPDNPDASQRIYWLSIVAVYPQGVDLQHPWGWTNHEWVFMDDAVRGVPIPGGVNPWDFDWFEQYDYSGVSCDLSFVIETTPDCYIVGQPRYYDENMNPGPPITPANYAAWVAAGKPDCWCCPHHGYGDVNGDGWINSSDVPIVWNAVLLGLSPPRADVNHDGFVNPSDVPEVWNKVILGVPQLPNTCPDCGP